MNNYKKTLFAQMRVFVITEDVTEMTDETLVKAMTVNENIKEAYGYCFKPEDIIRLAKYAGIDRVFEEFKSLQGEVLAEPMYPDFPKQVMALDEAQFRLHQLIHYFTTYGIEFLTGEEVSKGWLPDVTSTEKTKADASLLEAKTVELISEADMFIVPVKRILGKKERMTLPEEEIISMAIAGIEPAALAEITIPFKENLTSVFCLIADTVSPEQALPMLHSLCQHTGDVWKCVKALLGTKKYHLTTSQKKLVVKLFESYPVSDFESNLILSTRKAEKVIRLLEHLSYNRFSRSAEHKEAVRALRNGELRSWQGKAEYLMFNDRDKALDFIAERPGMLVRMTARLIRLGFKAEEIAEKLTEHAESLSMQTLITLMNFFGTESVLTERGDEADAVYCVMHKALTEKMSYLETPIKGKKVFLDEGDFNFELSQIEFSDKSAEGGYIRSGLAFRIPEAARRIRFFVYWNDDRRVDVDLHTAAVTTSGRRVHIGWDGECDEEGIVCSGDETHSDAAEYVDIDLENTDVACASCSIDLYYGAESFGDIDTCFTGITAVSSIGEDVVLYDPKNCFYSHELRSEERGLYYGHVDVANRTLVVSAKPNGRAYDDDTATKKALESKRFSLKGYLEELAVSQQAQIVTDRSEADVVLVMGKPNTENEISIIDSNFFCD